MAESFTFHPARRGGLFFHTIAVSALGGAAAAGLWQASRAEAGGAFLLYLLPALLAVAIAPLFAYRGYALWRAAYTLERDGIELVWGLRSEEIPMDEVLWLRPVETLPEALPLPWPRWPGAWLGVRRLPDGLTAEFFAARRKGLLAIGTPRRVFLVSPADVDGFVSTFRRLTELGTVSPITARSVTPDFLLAAVWADRAARYALLAWLALSLALLVWVTLAIPAQSQVSLRVAPGGIPIEFVPGVRLMLLPVLNGLIFAADLLLGLFFYRREENRLAAYLLWGSGLLTTLLFGGAVYFILQAA